MEPCVVSSCSAWDEEQKWFSNLNEIENLNERMLSGATNSVGYFFSDAALFVEEIAFALASSTLLLLLVLSCAEEVHIP